MMRLRRVSARLNPSGSTPAFGALDPDLSADMPTINELFPGVHMIGPHPDLTPHEIDAAVLED